MSLWSQVIDKIRALAPRHNTVARSSPTGAYQINVDEDPDDEDGDGPGQDPAPLYQQYGFRSRPVVGSEAITVALRGAPSQRVIIATETPGTGPDDLNEGEVAIYSSAGQVVLLDKDGQVTITTSAGSQVQMASDGSITLTDGSGGSAKLASGCLTVVSDVARRHDLGTGPRPGATGTPTFTTINSVTGTDRLFRVTVTADQACPLGTVLFTATFATAYLSGGLGQVTLESGDKKFSASVSNSNVAVTAGESFPNGSVSTFVVSTGGTA